MHNLAMDLGIHAYLVSGRLHGSIHGEMNGETTDVASSEEVAKATSADPVLMQRIMRNLAALGHVEEVDVDSYRAGKFSKAFTTTAGIAGHGCA